jgi:predicted nucleotidyltransferase
MLEITAPQLALVQRLLQQRLPRARVMAFGSRVAGWPFGRGAKPFSDLDLALFGLQSNDTLGLAHLRADLEESSLPWRVDLSDANDLPPALLALIEQHGACLQDQSTMASGTTG